ncbi:hypothetical protein STBA_02530 [Streptomyces sp. MP131-18]|nr:hypothetical protein [Streptomyces sp. MP131-18]ONK09413.1 hypothetical protein STBA_01130 [Streptomyces sp. MP131-18]ONK09553.1 hypothetical protein STBA_02530 [Streptomyces sp. MP131-18]
MARPRIVVYPPSGGGRRVRVDDAILGRARGLGELLRLLRQAGITLDEVRLGDDASIEWRGGGPTAWE